MARHPPPSPALEGRKNPYLIWLSEIILQQTRVAQGLSYFEKFKEAYPTVHDLADAPEDEVMKMWEGLGYYSRARNLHAAAKYIAYELGGVFPDTYEDIRLLKGVGPYTAAAIASFAYDLPYAVVDGNVYRVLSRYFGISEPVDTTAGKKRFAQLAQKLLDETRPGAYNQAIMDFGATHCMPATPKCDGCPMQRACVAFQQDKVGAYPVKSKKLKRKERFFNYLVIRHAGSVFIKKRTGKDIWRNLYDFPLIETEKLVHKRDTLLGHSDWQAWLGGVESEIRQVSPPFKQELTHQRIIARFWEVETGDQVGMPDYWMRVPSQTMREYAFPRVIDLYFREKFLPFDVF